MHTITVFYVSRVLYFRYLFLTKIMGALRKNYFYQKKSDLAGTCLIKRLITAVIILFSINFVVKRPIYSLFTNLEWPTKVNSFSWIFQRLLNLLPQQISASINLYPTLLFLHHALPFPLGSFLFCLSNFFFYCSWFIPSGFIFTITFINPYVTSPWNYQTSQHDSHTGLFV